MLQRYYEPRNYFPAFRVTRCVTRLTWLLSSRPPQLTIEDLWAGKNVVRRIAVQTQAFRPPSPFAPKVEHKALGDTAAHQDIYFSGTGFYGEIQLRQGCSVCNS